VIYEDYLLDGQQRQELCEALARTLDNYVSGPV